jgi:hypothetical protein
MVKGSGQKKRFPRDFLRDVAWSFTAPTFRSRARFEQAMRTYYREMGWEFNWDPDEIVLRCPRVRVRPVFWDDFDPEEEECFIAELTADSPSGFTAGELLFKVHNAFLRRWQEDAGDYTFFEGFHLVKAPAGDAAPLYDIAVGS